MPPVDFEVGSLACSSERGRGNTTFSTGRLIKSKATRQQRVAFFVSVSFSMLPENVPEAQTEGSSSKSKKIPEHKILGAAKHSTPPPQRLIA